MKHTKRVFLVIGLAMLGACGKVVTPTPAPVPTPPPPVPTPVVPVPLPKTTFTVKGISIQVEGTVKPGANTTADVAEATVKSALAILER